MLLRANLLRLTNRSPSKYIAPPGGPWLLRKADPPAPPQPAPPQPAPQQPAPPQPAPRPRARRTPAIVLLIQETNEHLSRGIAPGTANSLLLPASVAAMQANSTPAPPPAGGPMAAANPLVIRATHRILRPRLNGAVVNLTRSQRKTT